MLTHVKDRKQTAKLHHRTARPFSRTPYKYPLGSPRTKMLQPIEPSDQPAASESKVGDSPANSWCEAKINVPTAYLVSHILTAAAASGAVSAVGILPVSIAGAYLLGAIATCGFMALETYRTRMWRLQTSS